MKVSVALATFNGAEYVAAQLESVLAQDRRVDEIVVSDDSSTDATVEMVARTVEMTGSGAAAPELIIATNPGRRGVAANFDSALGRTTGDIVFLCDQDDIWHRDRVGRVIDVFGDDPAVLMVSSDARLVDASGTPTGTTLFGGLRMSEAERRALAAGDAFRPLLRRNLVTGATTAVRRELVLDSHPTPPGWLHDEWLAMVAAIRGGLRSVPEALVDYRQHGANVIGVEKGGIRSDLRRLMVPRDQRDRRLLLRARQLHERAGRLTPRPPSADLDLIAEKLLHERRRSALSPVRAARLLPVLRETLSGRYHRFGGGARDVLRDVVQPAGGPPPD